MSDKETATIVAGNVDKTTAFDIETFVGIDSVSWLGSLIGPYLVFEVEP